MMFEGHEDTTEREPVAVYEYDASKPDEATYDIALDPRLTQLKIPFTTYRKCSDVGGSGVDWLITKAGSQITAEKKKKLIKKAIKGKLQGFFINGKKQKESGRDDVRPIVTSTINSLDLNKKLAAYAKEGINQTNLLFAFHDWISDILQKQRLQLKAIPLFLMLDVSNPQQIRVEITGLGCRIDDLTISDAPKKGEEKLLCLFELQCAIKFVNDQYVISLGKFRNAVFDEKLQKLLEETPPYNSFSNVRTTSLKQLSSYLIQYIENKKEPELSSKNISTLTKKDLMILAITYPEIAPSFYTHAGIFSKLFTSNERRYIMLQATNSVPHNADEVNEMQTVSPFYKEFSGVTYDGILDFDRITDPDEKPFVLVPLNEVQTVFDTLCDHPEFYEILRNEEIAENITSYLEVMTPDQRIQLMLRTDAKRFPALANKLNKYLAQDLPVDVASLASALSDYHKRQERNEEEDTLPLTIVDLTIDDIVTLYKAGYTFADDEVNNRLSSAKNVQVPHGIKRFSQKDLKKIVADTTDVPTEALADSVVRVFIRDPELLEDCKREHPDQVKLFFANISEAYLKEVLKNHLIIYLDTLYIPTKELPSLRAQYKEKETTTLAAVEPGPDPVAMQAEPPQAIEPKKTINPIAISGIKLEEYCEIVKSSEANPEENSQAATTLQTIRSLMVSDDTLRDKVVYNFEDQLRLITNPSKNEANQVLDYLVGHLDYFENEQSTVLLSHLTPYIQKADDAQLRQLLCSVDTKTSPILSRALIDTLYAQGKNLLSVFGVDILQLNSALDEHIANHDHKDKLSPSIFDLCLTDLKILCASSPNNFDPAIVQLFSQSDFKKTTQSIKLFPLVNAIELKNVIDNIDDPTLDLVESIINLLLDRREIRKELEKDPTTKQHIQLYFSLIPGEKLSTLEGSDLREYLYVLFPSAEILQSLLQEYNDSTDNESKLPHALTNLTVSQYCKLLFKFGKRESVEIIEEVPMEALYSEPEARTKFKRKVVLLHFMKNEQAETSIFELADQLSFDLTEPSTDLSDEIVDYLIKKPTSYDDLCKNGLCDVATEKRLEAYLQNASATQIAQLICRLDSTQSPELSKLLRSTCYFSDVLEMSADNVTKALKQYRQANQGNDDVLRIMPQSIFDLTVAQLEVLALSYQTLFPKQLRKILQNTDIPNSSQTVFQKDQIEVAKILRSSIALIHPLADDIVDVLSENEIMLQKLQQNPDLASKIRTCFLNMGGKQLSKTLEIIPRQYFSILFKSVEELPDIITNCTSTEWPQSVFDFTVRDYDRLIGEKQSTFDVEHKQAAAKKLHKLKTSNQEIAKKQIYSFKDYLRINPEPTPEMADEGVKYMAGHLDDFTSIWQQKTAIRNYILAASESVLTTLLEELKDKPRHPISKLLQEEDVIQEILKTKTPTTELASLVLNTLSVNENLFQKMIADSTMQLKLNEYLREADDEAIKKLLEQEPSPHRAELILKLISVNNAALILLPKEKQHGLRLKIHLLTASKAMLEHCLSQLAVSDKALNNLYPILKKFAAQKGIVFREDMLCEQLLPIYDQVAIPFFEEAQNIQTSHIQDNPSTYVTQNSWGGGEWPPRTLQYVCDTLNGPCNLTLLSVENNTAIKSWLSKNKTSNNILLTFDNSSNKWFIYGQKNAEDQVTFVEKEEIVQPSELFDKVKDLNLDTANSTKKILLTHALDHCHRRSNGQPIKDGTLITSDTKQQYCPGNDSVDFFGKSTPMTFTARIVPAFITQYKKALKREIYDEIVRSLTQNKSIQKAKLEIHLANLFGEINEDSDLSELFKYLDKHQSHLKLAVGHPDYMLYTAVQGALKKHQAEIDILKMEKLRGGLSTVLDYIERIKLGKLAFSHADKDALIVTEATLLSIEHPSQELLLRASDSTEKAKMSTKILETTNLYRKLSLGYQIPTSKEDSMNKMGMAIVEKTNISYKEILKYILSGATKTDRRKNLNAIITWDKSGIVTPYLLKKYALIRKLKLTPQDVQDIILSVARNHNEARIKGDKVAQQNLKLTLARLSTKKRHPWGKNYPKVLANLKKTDESAYREMIFSFAKEGYGSLNHYLFDNFGKDTKKCIYDLYKNLFSDNCTLTPKELITAYTIAKNNQNLLKRFDIKNELPAIVEQILKTTCISYQNEKSKKANQHYPLNMYIKPDTIDSKIIGPFTLLLSFEPQLTKAFLDQDWAPIVFDMCKHPEVVKQVLSDDFFKSQIMNDVLGRFYDSKYRDLVMQTYITFACYNNKAINAEVLPRIFNPDHLDDLNKAISNIESPELLIDVYKNEQLSEYATKNLTIDQFITIEETFFKKFDEWLDKKSAITLLAGTGSASEKAKNEARRCNEVALPIEAIAKTIESRSQLFAESLYMSDEYHNFMKTLRKQNSEDAEIISNAMLSKLFTENPTLETLKKSLEGKHITFVGNLYKDAAFRKLIKEKLDNENISTLEESFKEKFTYNAIDLYSTYTGQFGKLLAAEEPAIPDSPKTPSENSDSGSETSDESRRMSVALEDMEDLLPPKSSEKVAKKAPDETTKTVEEEPPPEYVSTEEYKRQSSIKSK